MTAGGVPANGQAGFSLIEVMVALVILAVAAAGLIRASEAHVDSVRGLERRTAASMVAQNRLAELRLGEPARRAGAETEMLGEQWLVEDRLRATDDPGLVAATVLVTARGDSAPLVSLDGFIARGNSL